MKSKILGLFILSPLFLCGVALAESPKGVQKVSAIDTPDMTINSDSEFADFISSVNAGARYDGELIHLTNDVSFEITVKPTSADPWSIFGGVFDGLNHTITITVSMSDACPSLFRNIGSGSLKNAVFKNANLIYTVGQDTSSGQYPAPLATYNNGLIQNVHATVQYNANNTDVGGIVFRNQTVGTIENCSCEGSITAGQKIGGIALDNQGIIRNCTNRATIESSEGNVGGICATNSGTIDGCSSSGTITATTYIGGIVGTNTKIVQNSINRGTINASGKFIGGIVGCNGASSSFPKSKIINCVNYGNVINTSDDSAGICGFMYSNSEISYCSNYGVVSTTSSTSTTAGTGGIVGRINGADSTEGHETIIEYCYNVGDVSANYLAGGLLGLVQSTATPAVQIRGCFTTGDVSAATKNGGTLIGFSNTGKVVVTDSYAVGTPLGVAKAGIGGGTAASTATSLANGVSSNFKAVVKFIREYTCSEERADFLSAYAALSEAETTLLGQVEYYDELTQFSGKTYLQAAEYIANRVVSGESNFNFIFKDNNTSIIAVGIIVVTALALTTSLVFLRKKKER